MCILGYCKNCKTPGNEPMSNRFVGVFFAALFAGLVFLTLAVR